MLKAYKGFFWTKGRHDISHYLLMLWTWLLITSSSSGNKCLLLRLLGSLGRFSETALSWQMSILNSIPAPPTSCSLHSQGSSIILVHAFVFLFALLNNCVVIIPLALQYPKGPVHFPVTYLFMSQIQTIERPNESFIFQPILTL